MSTNIADPESDLFFLLKAAQRDLIKACGGIGRVSHIAGYSTSHVGRWNSTKHHDLMPLSVVPRLENECGVPFVTTAMAASSGHGITDCPKIDGLDGGFAGKFLKLSEVLSVINRTGIEVMADGQVSPMEADIMDRVLSEAESKIKKVRRDMAAVKAANAPVCIVTGKVKKGSKR